MKTRLGYHPSNISLRVIIPQNNIIFLGLKFKTSDKILKKYQVKNLIFFIYQTTITL